MKKAIAALITFVILGSHQPVRASEISEKKLTITNETARPLYAMFKNIQATYEQGKSIVEIGFWIGKTTDQQVLTLGVNKLTATTSGEEKDLLYPLNPEKEGISVDFATASAFAISLNTVLKRSAYLNVEDNSSYKVTVNNGELLLEKVEQD